MFNLDKMREVLLNWTPRVLVFILLICLGFFLIKRLTSLVEKRLGSRNLNMTALGFFLSILAFSLRVLVVTLGLGILKVPMASISAVVGAATLSIGLALQGSLANLAGGLILVSTEPFKVGDYISSGEFEGSVEEIAILTTHLKSIDGKRIVIPNSIISSQTIVNYSSYEMRRVDIKLVLSYDSPIDKVKEVLEDAARKIPGSQRAQAFLNDYADRGYEFILRVWFRRDSYLQDKYKLNELIKPSLDSQGLELAYPHLEVLLPGGNNEKIH